MSTRQLIRGTPSTDESGPPGDPRILGCLFSHTPFSLWGLHLVERTLRILWSDYHIIHCQDLTGLRDAWAHRGGRPALIATDAPKDELLRLLAATGVRCFVFLDDPLRLIEQAIYQHGVAPMDALRGCTHFFATFAQAAAVESALVFRSDEVWQTAETVARNIVCALSPEGGTHGDLEAIVAAAMAETPARPALERGSDPLEVALTSQFGPRTLPTSKDLDVINVVLDCYRALYRPEGMNAVQWPREMFFTGNADEGRPQEILLAGEARTLIRGPYCALPAGRWRLTVEFEVVDHVACDTVEADVVFGFGAGTLARGLFVLPERGIFRVALTFGTDEIKPALEFRLRTLRGAIRGVLGLRSVAATRLGIRGAASPVD